MFSLDLTDAYHHIGVHESDVDYFTFAVETEAGVEYFSTPALNFGWTLSPWVFTQVLRDVVRYLRNPDAAARPRYGQRRRHPTVGALARCGRESQRVHRVRRRSEGP